ncbi:MAG: hypothetical protein VB009_01605 [Erysipelotrichaceae bacterium]|nr:hypothetical protein [Erysipelotrichaceae bacterium]
MSEKTSEPTSLGFLSSKQFEDVLPQELIPSSSSITNGVLGTLFSGFKQLFNNITNIIKDKKRLILVLILAVLWLLASILPALGFNVAGISFISWLSFAQGGLGGNILNKMAGVIGKGVFAYAISLVAFDKSLLSNATKSITTLMKSVNLKNVANPLLWMMISVALIIYNLTVKTTTIDNSMAGIAFLVLALRSLNQSSGFLSDLLRSMFNFIKPINQDDLIILKSGWTFGFALATMISLLNIAYGGYIIGIALLVLAITLQLTSKKQEVKK